jgi:hypothetical protein
MLVGNLLCCLLTFPILSYAGSAVETFIVYRGDASPDDIPEEALQDAIQTDGASLLAKSSDDWITSTTQPPEGEGHSDSGWFGCEDKPPEQTGFEVHTDDGFLGYASCQDLTSKCHNWLNSTKVQQACPVSCFICDPNAKPEPEGPPCYDAISTGIKFKLGPQATCADLANYCNHTALWYHVQAACRLTCGLCDAHVGHVSGKCHDLEAHDEPEFMVAGQISACTDLVDFCDGAPDSYIIRHKCPRTCGACPDQLTSTTQSSYTSTANPEDSFNTGQEKSDCDRRRRWGFCSTRRRRNL